MSWDSGLGISSYEWSGYRVGCFGLDQFYSRGDRAFALVYKKYNFPVASSLGDFPGTELTAPGCCELEWW